MGEASAEASAVNVVSAAFRDIDFFTTRTENFESGGSRDVADTHGEHFLLVAESARTVAVACSQELFKNFSLASGGVDISRMD